MKRVMISQSNYIPWKGFFDAINSVDTYVVYDEVQYTRRDWRNRNKIKTPQGPAWLSIPVEVKGKYSQKISETKVSSPAWASLHWQTIRHSYNKAPYFKELSPVFADIYTRASGKEFLSDINHLIMTELCKLLEIKTNFIPSSQLNLNSGKSERILGICCDLMATDYYSGPSAKGYLNEEIFSGENINVHYFDFSGYPEYDQLYPPFEHAVSVIDLLFMKGPEAPKYIFKNSAQRLAL